MEERKVQSRIFKLLRSIRIDSEVPIRQPYSYSVSNPRRLFKNFSTGQEITVQCRALQDRTWTEGRTGPSRKKSTVQESDAHIRAVQDIVQERTTVLDNGETM
jgi:hypothetical protein